MAGLSLQTLFRGYSKRHGCYQLKSKTGDKYEGNAYTVDGEPSTEAFDAHIAGKGAGLGIIPLMDDNRSAVFGCIDIDRYDLDFHALERDTAQLPLVITKSKSGGAHLWLFTSEPVPAKLIQQKLGEWAAALGFGGCEIFPKQTARADDSKDVGNWINLPYYGDARRCWLEGVEVSYAKFLAHVSTRLMNQVTLESIKVNSGELFADGPPCLQHIAGAGIMPGTRNVVMFNVGVYLRKKNPSTWHDEFNRFNIEILKENALPLSEIQTLIKSVEKKEYFYQCDVSPLCTHCNKRACLKREFGVGGDAQIPVMLTGLTKLNCDPPLWFLDVDSVRIELDNIEKLLGLHRFRVVCAEKVHKLIPSSIKQGTWDKTVQDLLEQLQIVEAPEDAGSVGMFKHHFQQFVEIRGQYDAKDRLTNGNAWIDGEDVYFRSPDLGEHLKRQQFKDLTMQQVWNVLREEYEAERGRFHIKGATVAYWKVRFGNLQTESNTLPAIGEVGA